MLDSPDIPHPAYVPIEVLDPDYDPLSDGVRDSTRDTRTDTNLLLARYPDYYDTPYQGRAGTSEGYRTSGVQTQHEREYEHGARQKQSYYPGAEQEAEHEPEQAGEQQVPHPSHPKNPIPSLAPTHHISISGISQSGISNRSAGSKHSVFSTPGRDELERKKALVEADQGPFGRAVSVADLNAKRRVISGGGEEGVGRKVDATEREGCACGLGGRCAVM
ncbi:hypothetical protein BDW02DRAFT_574364 [Decorospora gaudefroyi]|uniref:Uncharacterized protein n=1 Tax=Decorospora gaudefroyi TaxID=184978 RepID=A0A6A5JY11_9PLEO|nr:hypothetical protein BDW02DRAFT_574364 [Decorospora gaudefroyi]